MTKHGAPDWSIYRIDSQTYTVMDLAELAARLGSIVIFDRRGDVVLLEDFSCGLNRWSAILEGTDAAASLSPTYVQSLGYSVKLTCGSDGQRSAGIRIPVPYPRQAAYGLEASFTFETNHAEFRLALTVYDSTDKHVFQIKYKKDTGRVQYLDADNAYQDLTPVCKTYINANLFNTMKIVANPITDTYERAILNRQTYDLADIPCYTTADATGQHFQIDLSYVGADGENPTGYADTIILTADEP